LAKRRIYVDNLRGMLEIKAAAELFNRGEAELVFFTTEFSQADLERRFVAALGQEDTGAVCSKDGTGRNGELRVQGKD